MINNQIIIVGAGISGLTIARKIAENNPSKQILIIEKRNHIGGNCYDFYDDHGILVQKYGPHIFHTNDKKAWDFLSRFTDWIDYKHKVIAKYKNDYYSIPINRYTINKFFKINLQNEKEVKKYLSEIKIPVKEIKNSKDAIISKFGSALYEAFIKDYSKKQWGIYPDKLPPAILERLPIRYDENDYYFNDKFQGLPKFGFTKMFEKMIDLPNIVVYLNQDFNKDKYNNMSIIYTGSIDEFFDYKYGKLPYRYTKFLIQTLNQDSSQPNSVVNFPEKKYKHIRITEFKKFTSYKHNKTTICKEYIGEIGIPVYPLLLKKSLALYNKYLTEAPENIYFLGRLGRYKYLDMDKACEEALALYEEIKNNV